MALVLAVVAAYGVYLVYTNVALGWSGIFVGPSIARARDRYPRYKIWLLQAGLEGVNPAEFVGVMAALATLGTFATYAVFNAPLPALIVGVFAAAFPISSYRGRRERRIANAREAWPAMLEEIRVLTCSSGLSIPQALFQVGRDGPDELREAFAAGEREWLITTDFARTVRVLKDRLADSTADAICETLLIANSVGSTGLDRRLAALIEDRSIDLQGRKDARAKQAGVRFARRFVLAVPFGMALVGISIGTGRSAYRSGGGQIAVAFGIFVVVACWIWAGRLLRLPEEDRVFVS